ncbi:HD domain-containing protein [Streptomyces massasporeus]|uniref:HD domain-containing protein n=1 Tax=Streptomyces massasporeus TaxID=67324 RepID=UPI003456D7D4
MLPWTNWPQACGEHFLEGYGVEIQWDRPPRGWGEPRIVQFAALLQDLRRRYFALIRHLTGATIVPTEVSAPAAVLITGVGVIADWLASQRHYWLPVRALGKSIQAAERA